MPERKFILWDPKDNFRPREDDEGSITSDGVLGRVTVGNVYLTTYGEYPDERRPADLKVGDSIKGVKYSLSGSRGVYDIYRVA